MTTRDIMTTVLGRKATTYDFLTMPWEDFVAKKLYQDKTIVFIAQSVCGYDVYRLGTTDKFIVVIG